MKALLSVLLFVVASVLCPARAVDYVHLSEIMYDTPLNEVITAPPYSNGEYIELYNAGENTVDLSGWQVRGDGATEVCEFASLVMPPHSFLILAYRNDHSPEFVLDDLFAFVDNGDGQIIYQNTITLKNTKEYVRLYDADHVLRDSVYYGNETSIQPASDRLIATNGDNTAGSECVSVQRIYTFFRPDGTLIPNHLDWDVLERNPMSLPSQYAIPGIPRQHVSYAYDAAGNRISRTIVLSASSRRNSARSKTDREGEESPQVPLSDMLDKQDVTIYPNPTQGRLVVHITGGDLSGQIVGLLYDMQGTLLLQRDIEPDHMNELDLSTMPSGVYFLHLSAGSSSVKYKIIKR